MDDRAAQLIVAQISDADLRGLLAEARAEALAELRAILKRQMLDDLLARAAGLARPEASAPADPAPAAPPLPPPAEPTQADIAAELADLRARLAANRAAPVAPEPAATPPVAPAGSADEGWGVYVYAVVAAGLALPRVAGVYPELPLELLPHGDVAAVVGRVPLAELGEAALAARSQDLGWLEQVVRAHQAVLDALLPLGPVVPMRFATIFLSPERAAAMLAEQAPALRAALARLAGRAEWGVKLYADDAALAAAVAQSDPELLALRADVAARPAGAAYMLQKRLDRIAAAAAERLADTAAGVVHARLAERSAAALRSALHPRAAGAAEQMLLNGAYLVDHGGQASFQAELERLAAEYGPLGLRLELSGPWPAYSFVAGGEA